MTDRDGKVTLEVRGHTLDVPSYNNHTLKRETARVRRFCADVAMTMLAEGAPMPRIDDLSLRGLQTITVIETYRWRRILLPSAIMLDTKGNLARARSHRRVGVLEAEQAIARVGLLALGWEKINE